MTVSAERIGSPWRRRAGWFTLVLGCLALFVANLAVFLRMFVFDSGTFTDAVAPREPDEAVVDALAEDLSIRVLEAGDVQRRIQDLTPNDNPLVAAVVSNGAGRLVEDVARRVMESAAFRTVWRAVVDRAHTRFTAMVDDGDRRRVVLDLTETLRTVDQRLEARGLDLISDETITGASQRVLLRRSQIAGLRRGLDLLRALSAIAVVVVVVLLAAAVAVAVDRRRTLLRIGIGAMVAMALTGLAARMARRVLLGRVDVDSRRRAVGSLWDRVTDQLSWQTTILFLVGASLAFGAWLAGPSRAASGLRRRLRHPLSPGLEPQSATS